MKLVARRLDVDTDGSTVNAAVGIGAVGDAFNIAVELTVDVPNAPDKDTALKLAEAAHQVCPYSNATRGNVVVDLTVN
jgi:organic hydroperoxide reductase OsmC/OhrA